MYSFPNLGPVRCFMSGCNWTGLLAAAVGWRRVGEYHSELGPLLAGLSQHAWGVWSEGLLTVRETGVRVIPCEHMHLTWSPLGCPCPLLEEGPPGAGLRWGICGNRGLHPFPGSLCRGPALHGHSGVQAARAPPPGDSVTVRITLGPALAAVSLSRLQGGSRRIGSALGHVACVSFPPRSTPFSQNSLLHSVHLFFLFCLLFNLYLDSFETLQSDLTLELSVAGAPHATGGCPKAPGAVLPGSPCTSVSPPAP